MSKIMRGVVVAAAAAGLVSTAAVPAQAAAGLLVLRDAGQGRVAFNDPRAGCSQVRAGFVRVTNRTDAPITVYDDVSCQGQSLVVLPGADKNVGVRHSFSVPW
ncbi:hypothetical protein GCM10009733_106090 [Nonomuraea maheshkhaliensis]|uniref:Secreted protein n=1 Tax=Nonomuraea maheshkhaliensis TaxID=419590 RepID=A0ABN2HSS6_9ACTN